MEGRIHLFWWWTSMFRDYPLALCHFLKYYFICSIRMQIGTNWSTAAIANGLVTVSVIHLPIFWIKHSDGLVPTSRKLMPMLVDLLP